MTTTGVIGAVAAVVVGGVAAAVTLIGLISGQVNSAGDNPADANNATITYGTTS